MPTERKKLNFQVGNTPKFSFPAGRAPAAVDVIFRRLSVFSSAKWWASYLVYSSKCPRGYRLWYPQSIYFIFLQYRSMFYDYLFGNPHCLDCRMDKSNNTHSLCFQSSKYLYSYISDLLKYDRNIIMHSIKNFSQIILLNLLKCQRQTRDFHVFVIDWKSVSMKLKELKYVFVMNTTFKLYRILSGPQYYFMLTDFLR